MKTYQELEINAAFDISYSADSKSPNYRETKTVAEVAARLMQLSNRIADGSMQPNLQIDAIGQMVQELLFLSKIQAEKGVAV